MDVIRRAADPKCMARLESSISTIDKILTSKAGHPFVKPLKGLFGLADLESNQDFVSVLEARILSVKILPFVDY